MSQGLIHIYCGDGKGKTSAALGLILRAVGRGRRALLIRFLKNDDSGELAVLKTIPGVEILSPDRTYGFVSRLNDEEKAALAHTCRDLWRRGTALASSGEYHLFVADEFMAAYNYGLIPKEEALSFLRDKPAALEVALTGRNPEEELVQLADYVSEVRKVKHPYDRGIPAREGVEY